MMYPKTAIEFSFYHEGQANQTLSSPETKIVYKIDGECTIHEACRAFENFLLACGFRLNPNENVEIVNNND